MVEPVPYVFERLRGNYAGVDRVTLENAAVGATDGDLPFYYLVDASDEERRDAARLVRRDRIVLARCDP